MNNFNIEFITPLNYKQLKEVESFIDFQQTTDRVRENTALYYNGDEGDYFIVIMLDGFDEEIKTITITVL